LLYFGAKILSIGIHIYFGKMLKKSKGFTLLELIAVAAIMGLLAVIIMPNYRGGEKQSALLRSAHRLAQDLRRVEEMAISCRTTPIEFGEEVFPKGGYGIYFEIDPAAPQGYHIIVFADCDSEGDYDDWGSFDCEDATPGPGHSRDETIEKLSLEEGIKVEKIQVDFSSVNFLPITFIPPDPTVIISDGNEAEITLSLKDNPTITRTITINKTGLIDVD